MVLGTGDDADGDAGPFFQQHVRDTVIFLEEVSLPHPRCLRCDILLPWKVLNGRHIYTAQCAKGEERNFQRIAEEEIRKSAERFFQAYERPLETVISLKYLGRVLTSGYENWLEVVGNLKKARKSWAWLTRILGREGANLWVSGMFFKSVVQAVLFFGLETWVLTPRMGRSLGIFQHRVTHTITGIQTRRWEEGGWEYLTLATAMEEAGFKEIGVYILKSHNMVA